MKIKICALVVCMLAFSAGRLSASDASNGDDFSVSLIGKVTAVDSTGVTVLGLKILIPKGVGVTSNGNWGGGDGGDGNDDNQGGDGGGGGGGDGSGGKHGDGDGGGGNGNGGNNGDGDGNSGDNGGGTTSATIGIGNFIKVELSSDATPLVAAAIQDWGGYDEGYRLKAPIQAVTSNGNVITVTVLGLVVDVSNAFIFGNSDDDSQSMPLTLADLAVGQNISITLDETKLPALVATHLNIRKASNEVEVDSGDGQGELSSDLTIDSSQVVIGNSTVTGKRIKKTIKLHTVTRSTKFVLRGLFPGKAKITYRYKGQKHTAKVTVAANGLTNLKLKLVK